MTEGYTKYIPDRLVAMVGLEAAALAARLVSFADADGIAEVSKSWLCGIYGWSGGSLSKYAKKLEVLQVWIIAQNGDGRKHKTKWKKGANFETFFSNKGSKICAEKGQNFEPIKIDIKNKNNAYAHGSVNRPAQRGRKENRLPIYLSGDTELTSAMIDSMVMLRYKGKVAYCYERDLQQCLAAGAELFKPKE